MVDSTNVLSNQQTVNPDFFDANHVFIPYCTGDVHGGTQSAANQWGTFLPVSVFPLVFSARF
jgi:hypothetical protein